MRVGCRIAAVTSRREELRAHVMTSAMQSMWRRWWLRASVALVAFMVMAGPLALTATAQQPEARAPEAVHRPGGEVNIQLPDLNTGDFLGMTGHQILLTGLVVCVLGLLFGAWTYNAVKNLPVHQSMADVSELIYETCKAYLIQQGKFLLILEVFIGTVMVAVLLADRPRGLQDRHRAALQPDRHRRQLRRGLVRHPHQHPGQLAHGFRQPATATPSRCATSRCVRA